MHDRKYDESTAIAIFKKMVWKVGESCVIREGGIFLNEEFCAHSPRDIVFDWTPAYDMDWPGSPNPMTAPLLPIPFTANELAACMLDGPGSGIQDAIDRRIGFPLDEEDLKVFSLSERWARDALEEAYALAAAAQLVVGDFDHDEEARAHTLAQQYDDANGQANDREGVFGQGITPDEASARRARAVASVADLKAHARRAQATVADKWKAWRKAMVRQLLQPQATTPSPAPVAGKKWTPEKLAELKAYRDGHTMPETAEKFAISEQRIWQLLPSGKPKAKQFTGLIHRMK